MKKKAKMNILGKGFIVLSFALMVYLQYRSDAEKDVLERLLNGAGAYVLCVLGGCLFAFAVWLSMYFSRMFLKEIYDNIDIQEVSNDITELLIPVGFITLYILHITGVFRLI